MSPSHEWDTVERTFIDFRDRGAGVAEVVYRAIRQLAERGILWNPRRFFDLLEWRELGCRLDAWAQTHDAELPMEFSNYAGYARFRDWQLTRRPRN
jgi:hypothetical protein